MKNGLYFQLDERWGSGHPQKRTKYYEAQFREKGLPGFSKRRVADQIKRKILTGKVDAETESALRKIVVKIVEALQRQVPGKKNLPVVVPEGTR